MNAGPDSGRDLSRRPPAWAVLSANIVRRLPYARYRVMNWLCRDSTARFVARIPGPGRAIRFDCSLENGLAREVFFTGKYEPQETLVIRRLVPSGGTFVDVGANWGYFTLIVAEHVGPAGMVVSIEADPRMFAILERNLALNTLPQVKSVQVAAAAESGTLTLFGFDDRDENWGVSRIASTGDSVPDSRAYRVPARRIDDILDEANVDVVDLIKIDIEGAEGMALSGMSEGLRRGRYRRILIELHPRQLAEHGTNAGKIIGELLGSDYQGWVVRHSAEDVRRAAYGRGEIAETYLRPLQWPELLDAWPHLVFVRQDLPLFCDGPAVADAFS